MSEILLASAPIVPGGGHEAGRRLLAGLYAARTGREMPPIRVEKRGKPYFPGEDLYFSISHTPRHVFCVLAGCAVGLDAEETDRRISLRLADKILSPSERVRWEAAPDRRAALLRLWVLKEAHAKCTGRGLAGYPNDTDFSPDDPRVFVRDDCYVAVIVEENDAV